MEYVKKSQQRFHQSIKHFPTFNVFLENLARIGCFSSQRLRLKLRLVVCHLCNQVLLGISIISVWKLKIRDSWKTASFTELYCRTWTRLVSGRFLIIEPVSRISSLQPWTCVKKDRWACYLATEKVSQTDYKQVGGGGVQVLDHPVM